MTSGDLNIGLSEKMTECSGKYSLRAIESFLRAFLSLLVFELRGVVVLTPPPPPHQGEGGRDCHPGHAGAG